ncbi:MAG: arsenate reductase (glutaredoxin) [Alphaproteobacteria bacterium]|nr:arsenate reductase (glutaredoxin) [Alphaproteobacteria bacterium]MBL7097963.1 arsenate reductase (glutaredoxin) [Alphaproteobacteria bacterium]
MKNITIYHNPKCSNSRGALALLEGKGIKPAVVEYLKTPLSRTELKKLAAALKATAGKDWLGLRDGMLRTREPVYAELGLKDASDDELLAAVAEHPILLNRPIVSTPKGTVLARPPETAESVL